MKFYDSLTKIYKKLQDKTLSVYIESYVNEKNKYLVTTLDDHITLHIFNSRENAIKFCNDLNINILAYITHK